MSAGFTMNVVMLKLEAGEVPAELAHAPTAECLMRNSKAIMGSDGTRLLAHIVAHGMVMGGGFEEEEPEEFKARASGRAGPRALVAQGVR